MFSDSVKYRPQICKIEFSYVGNILPSIVETSNTFYDDLGFQLEFESMYHSKGKASFKETCKHTSAGPLYNQTLNFSFPVMSKDRAVKLNKLQKIKFISFILTNGWRLTMGRNDFIQNAQIRPEYSSSLNKLNISFKTQTIFPLSFTEANLNEPANIGGLEIGLNEGLSG